MSNCWSHPLHHGNLGVGRVDCATEVCSPETTRVPVRVVDAPEPGHRWHRAAMATTAAKSDRGMDGHRLWVVAVVVGHVVRRDESLYLPRGLHRVLFDGNKRGDGGLVLEVHHLARIKPSRASADRDRRCEIAGFVQHFERTEGGLRVPEAHPAIIDEPLLMHLH